MATRSRTCSRRLGSRRRSAFLKRITVRSLLCCPAIHRSYCGCIIHFDTHTKISVHRDFLLPISPDRCGKSACTMNVDALTKSLISSRWLALSLAALFFVSVPDANADPVGDFVKKFGQSVSKAFQPRPTPNPTEKKTRHVSQRPSSRNRNPVQASPPPIKHPTTPSQ